MATFTALGTFVAIRVPFITWGVPVVPGAEELGHWKGLVVGLCTITLQVPFVWVSGLVLGPWQGMAAQAVMLAIGLAGLPIFIDGGGPGYVLRPTFGYLLGFLPAAWLAGRLAGRGPVGAFLGMLLGQAVLWTIGVAWQVVVTQPGAWLDGTLWRRSWAGALQLGPTYVMLMATLAVAAGLVGALRSAFQQQREGAVVDEVDGHHGAENAGSGR